MDVERGGDGRFGEMRYDESMLTILIITITLTMPTSTDYANMGAILCGEACGMGDEPMAFVANNLYYDWYTMDDLSTRWYAWKPNNDATRMMRQVFRDGPEWPRCKLVGSRGDAAYWRKHGYVEPGAVADYSWGVGEYEVNGFDCYWPRVVWEKHERILQ